MHIHLYTSSYSGNSGGKDSGGSVRQYTHCKFSRKYKKITQPMQCTCASLWIPLPRQAISVIGARIQRSLWRLAFICTGHISFLNITCLQICLVTSKKNSNYHGIYTYRFTLNLSQGSWIHLGTSEIMDPAVAGRHGSCCGLGQDTTSANWIKTTCKLD